MGIVHMDVMGHVVADEPLDNISVAPDSPHLSFRVNLRSFLNEFARLSVQALFQGFRFSNSLFCRIFPHILSDLHAAKMRAAHRAEMGGLCAFLGKSFVVEFAGSYRI